MNPANHSRLLKRMGLLSTAAAIGVFAIGGLVLSGWVFDIPVPTSVRSGLVSMNGLAALCFLLTGLALWLLQKKRARVPGIRLIAWVCASLVGLVGVVMLLEDFTHWRLGIAHLPLVGPAGTVQTLHSGRMAPNTAFNFVLIGLSLLLLDVRTRRGHRPALILIGMLGFVASLALLGYAYGVSVLYSPSATENPMSVLAAVAGLLAFAGLVLARPGPGLLGLLTSETPGGVMIRHLIVPILLMPMMLDLVILSGLRAGLFHEHAAAAAHTLLVTALFLVVVLVLATPAKHSGEDRYSAGVDRGGRVPQPITLDSPGRRLWFFWAVSMVVAATLVRLGFLQTLGMRAIYITFYPAVMLAALYGGLPAGLLATVLSALAACYFWIEPVGTFTIKDPADWLSIAIFLGSGTLVSGLAEAMHRARARAEDAGRRASAAEIEVQLAAERAHTEEALRCNEEQLRIATNAAEIGVWSWKPGTSEVVVSANWRRLFGIAPETAVTFDIWREALHPDDRERAVAELNAASELHREFDTEYRVLRPDGSIGWIVDRGRAWYDELGQPIGMAGVNVDITERKRAEEVISQNVRLLNATGALAKVGGWELDLATQHLAWTDEVCRIHGVEPDYQPKLEEAIDFYAPEFRPAIEAAVKRGSETGEAWDLEARFMPRGREDSIWVRAIGRAISSGGKVVKLTGAFQDITARKLAEEALREGEERLRFALETCHIGAWDLDLVDQTAYRSLEHDRIFGYPDLLPRWTYEMALAHVIPEDRAIFDGSFQRAIATQSDWNFECRIRRADGEIRWIYATGRHRTDAAGGMRRMAGIVQDITARKQAEEALRQSEQQFRTMADAMPQLAWIGRADGWLHWYNRRWYEYTGTTPAQMEGWGWQSVHDPDALPKVMTQWQECIATGEAFEMTFPLRGADGVFRPFLTRGMPFKDEQGRVLQWFGTNTDVSEQKRVEEVLQRAHDELEKRVTERTAELQESQQRFTSMLEGVRDYAIVFLDQEGRVVTWNKGVEQIKGYRAEEIIGEHFSRFYPPEDLAAGKHDEHLRKALAEGRFEEENWRVRKDGSRFWANVVLTALRDVNGTVNGFVKITRDLTARKEAEAALLESEREFRTLAESMPQMVWVCQPDGMNIYFSQSWVTYTGLTLEESYGRGWNTPFHPDDKQAAWDAWNHATATGAIYQIECRLRRKDGTYHWFITRGVPLRDDQGHILKWFGTCTDIDDLKRAEENIRGYAADLQRSNQELEHFAYVASHDLQEPLRTVGSFSQLLATRYQGKLGSDADEFITYIVEGAKRMQSLINDLLAFSRVGTRDQGFAPMAGEASLRTAQENIEVAIEESGAVITHDPLPMLWGDQGQLTQVFQNLLSNAIKFRRPDTPPRIHITAVPQGDLWQISVRDNGIGIDPQYFDRIFVIFQRLHDRETYPGTGIGLAICKKIVERHGGRLWVESTPGAGSCFHFTISGKPKNP